MLKHSLNNNLSYCLEPLEGRTLLAGTPWGAYPQLIDQDLAVANYSQYNGAGQTIVFIDTGEDYNHPALQGKYLGGYDFVNNDSNPMDTDGHGTGLATIAVGNAYTFNGAKYQGIAPGARFISLRVDDDKDVPDSRYEQAFQWIIANRVKYNITVVNASFGGGHYATEAQRSVYADEMAQLAADGVFIVAASGNDGGGAPLGIEYPAADPSAFAAGSINSSDVISKFTERSSIMDILAPGENVPTGYLDDSGQPIYLEATGSSFSAPFIAGAAAILKQIDPNFTPHDIMSILRASGVDNYDGDREAKPYTQLSWPRLDLDGAIALALTRKTGQPGANQLGAAGRENALKYDRDGTLYYSWYDANAHNLKFASYAADGNWSGIKVIDGGTDVGHFVSMALTSTGKPAVAYYDSHNADLKYAEWDGSKWDVETVDAKLSTGLYPSLAFDQFDDPIITYYYKNAGNLKMAFDDGSGWKISTIDAQDDTGRYSSLVLSKTGQWTVAYENTTRTQVKFAKMGSSAWSFQVADTTRYGGGFISLAYNAANQPAVSYYDAYNADLKFAQFNGSRWNAGAVASQSSQGLYTNLIFDADGTADILYYSKSADSVFRATGSPGDWTVESIIADGGRHVAVARYGNSRAIFSYYRASSNALLIDSL
jgi:hypothetical protein